MAYNKLIGLIKSVKNTAIVMGLPAILYLLNGAADWMPTEQYLAYAPFIGAACYFIKNYLENKD